MQWACRKSATTRLMHRSKLKCSAAAWGPFKEFGLVANRAPSPNYSQASHITVPGAQLSIRLLRGRSADAAPTDQLNDAGSHGGMVQGSEAYAPTSGARTQSRPSRAPRWALTSAPLATCRYSRAITGVVSMAAAINPADKTLNLVILVSPLGTEAKTFWRLLWK
jgi:hypothetical protein